MKNRFTKELRFQKVLFPLYLENVVTHIYVKRERAYLIVVSDIQTGNEKNLR